MERIQEALKDENPFCMKSNQPSVVVDPTILEVDQGESLEEVSAGSIANRI
jgi:hypothetical protein